jgi:ATP-dependent helicase/nuclease subunit A
MNNTDPKRIVCITYTNNAARQMREKIYEALEKFMTLDDDAVREEIKKIDKNIVADDDAANRAKTLFIKVLDNSDNLKIFTIHSFCQQLLSKFPLEAGILPNFSIIDDSQKNILIKKSIDYLLDNIDKYENLREHFENVVKVVAEDNFYPMAAGFADKKREINYLKSVDYGRLLLNYFNLTDDNWAALLENHFLSFPGFEEFYDFLGELDVENSKNKPFKLLRKFLDGGKENLDDYFGAFLTKEMGVRKIGGLSKDAKTNEKFINIFLKEAERAISLYQQLENIQSYRNTVDIIAIAAAVVEIYDNLRRNAGLLDFNDLIGLTADLLKNSEYADWVRYKLDDKIEHILLDEGQDVSKEQWKIIESLTDDFFAGKSSNENLRSLFVVGDEKQSIFRFQGAAPELFTEKYFFYKKKIQNFDKINLEYSFRSAKNILKFVDKFFEREDFSQKISKLENRVKHGVARGNVGGLVEAWPLADAKKPARDVWSFKFALDQETEKEKTNALNIVRKIKSFFDNGKQLTFRDGRRDFVKYGDILLLVERRSGRFLFYLIKYLNICGIDNSGFDIVDLFDNIFVSDLMGLMYFCRFENDDLNLANIIKSPILNMKEEDLAALCDFKNKNNVSLWEAMKTLRPQQFAFLDNLKKESNVLGIYDFFFRALEELGIRKSILERAGEEFGEVLNEFLSFVREYEKNKNSDFVMFLNYVLNSENKIKKDFNSRELNQVRIMTRHSSKGLQAPIVFICDANRPIEKRESEEILFWHSDGDFEFPLLNRKSGSDAAQNFMKIHREKQGEERFRLFYVSMTRAENELYICGVKGNDGEKKSEEYKNFYEIAIDALKSLGAEEAPFDFNGDQIKYVFGSDEKYDKLSKTEDSSEKIDYARRLDELKNIDAGNCKMEIFNPSQFFKHNDRDRMFSGTNINITMGLAAHKLLEILPAVEKEKRGQIGDIYLNNMFGELTPDERAKIKEQTAKILNSEEYSIFFGPNSRAEAAVVGEADGMSISGQIDRLVELEDRVIVLDYKNTRKNYGGWEELPKTYIKQLELYKKILRGHYGEKKIECYILLTGFFKLLSVPI